MKNQNSRLLYQYWLSRRGKRTAPNRSDINPTDVQHLLADSFILQLDLDGNPVYRLAGSRANALFGQELRGQPFAYIWAPLHRGSIRSATDIVIDDASCVVIGWRGRTNSGLRVDGETLLTPLTLNHSDKIERLLGIVSTATTPNWLGHQPVVELDVVTLRIIDPDRDNAVGLKKGDIYAQSGSGQGAPPAQTVLHLTSTRQVAHLAVFDGGRTD